MMPPFGTGSVEHPNCVPAASEERVKTDGVPTWKVVTQNQIVVVEGSEEACRHFVRACGQDTPTVQVLALDVEWICQHMPSLAEKARATQRTQRRRGQQAHRLLVILPHPVKVFLVRPEILPSDFSEDSHAGSSR